MSGNRLRSMLILIIMGIVLLLDYRISLGILLGLLFTFFHQKFLEFRVDALIRASEVSVLTYLGPLLGIVLLSLPILLCFLLPQVFHWSGVLIGLLYSKMFMYIEAFIGGKKNDD